MPTNIQEKYGVNKFLRSIEEEDRRTLNKHLEGLWEALSYLDNKPISTKEIKTIIKATESSESNVDFSNHLIDYTNPHNVTLEQARTQSNIINGVITGSSSLSIDDISENIKNLVSVEWVNAQNYLDPTDLQWTKVGSKLYPRYGESLIVGGTTHADSTNYLTVYGRSTLDGNVDILDSNIENIGKLQFDIDNTYECSEGHLAWCVESGTLKLGMPGGNVCGLMFEEIFLPNRPKNDQGTDILNGQAVYISGATGNVPKTKLANATNGNAECTIAVATEDILDGQRGFYTSYGLVNDIDTTFGGLANAGDAVFLDVTNGNLTLTELSYPNKTVKIGYIIRVHANQGSIFCDIEKRTWLNVFQAKQDPTGFYDRTDCTISYDGATRTITLTPVGDYFTYFLRGKEYRVTSPVSLTHPDTTGIYFFYYDENNTLTLSTTIWQFSEVPISFVYYNSTKSDGIVCEERHSAQRNTKWHQGQHNTIGTYYVSGLDIADYVQDPSSPVDDDNTYSISSGVLADEDIFGDLDGVADNGTYCNLYKTGASGTWTWDTDVLPFKYGTNIQYNEYTGASYVLTDVGNGDYVNYLVIGLISVDSDKSILIIPSINEYNSKDEAVNASIFEDYDFAGLPFVEFDVLYKITYRVSNGYSSTGNCRIENVQDLRGLTNRASILNNIIPSTPTWSRNTTLHYLTPFETGLHIVDPYADWLTSSLVSWTRIVHDEHFVEYYDQTEDSFKMVKNIYLDSSDIARGSFGTSGYEIDFTNTSLDLKSYSFASIGNTLTEKARLSLDSDGRIELEAVLNLIGRSDLDSLSKVDGDIWVRSTDDTIFFQEDGVVNTLNPARLLDTDAILFNDGGIVSGTDEFIYDATLNELNISKTNGTEDRNTYLYSDLNKSGLEIGYSDSATPANNITLKLGQYKSGATIIHGLYADSALDTYIQNDGLGTVKLYGDVNDVTLTDSGGGTNVLTDDGTYKSIGVISSNGVQTMSWGQVNYAGGTGLQVAGTGEGPPSSFSCKYIGCAYDCNISKVVVGGGSFNAGTLTIRRYSVLGSLIASATASISLTNNASYVYTLSSTLSCNAGDMIRADLNVSANDIVVQAIAII